MRVAVMTDIHSNDIAFRRCVDHALSSGAEAFCFLGDYVCDLAGVRETMALLREVMAACPCTLLRGNKEDYWLGDDASRAAWRYGSSSTGTLLYTHNLLTDEDKALFAALPVARQVTYPGLPPLLVCHGTPESNRGTLRDNEETRAMLSRYHAPIILCGHTHTPMALCHGGVTLINPGSVGVALGSGKTAHYLLLHGENGRWRHELVALNYDAEAAVQGLYDARLHELAPAWTRTTVQILRYGWPPKTYSLRRAMAISRERMGTDDGTDIPEECWEQALAEMNIP